MIVGIFGKIASGKSTFARKKQQSEAEKEWQILELDETGHDLLRDRLIQKKIEAVFPDFTFGPGEELNRKRLRENIFVDREKLSRLEAILHPRILEITADEIRLARKSGRNLLLVCALPEKIEMEKLCDEVVILPITKEDAWDRISKSRDMSRDIFEKIWEIQEDPSF